MEMIRQEAKAGRRPKPGDVCPSLLLHHAALCDVERNMYHPSDFQVQEFCTTGQHRRCPLRIAARRSLCDCVGAAR